jgi:hypothetical protein
MAGPVPAIRAFLYRRQDVDARHKAGHDSGTNNAPRYFFSGM